MHVLLTILEGGLLLCAALLFGKLWGGEVPAYSVAASLFIPVWLLLSLVNFWIGVRVAGYSTSEELPILLLVFALPALVAGTIIWIFR